MSLSVDSDKAPAAVTNIANRVDHMARPIHSFLLLSKYGNPTFPKI
jgi:hypothetical protein